MPNELRNFLFISDTKVDMYVPQASRLSRRSLRRRTQHTEGRLTLGAKSLGGELRHSTDSESDPDRIERLQVAERLIRRRADIGGVRDSAVWMEGELTMRWGYIYSPPYVRLQEGPLAVLFFAASDEHVVAFTGSARNVIGNDTWPPSRYASASKAAFWSTGRLWDYYQRRSSLSGLRAVATMQLAQDTARIAMGRAPRGPEDPFIRAAEMEHYLEDWGAQRLRFLAERLMDRPDVERPHLPGKPPVRVTIGSPLYVESLGSPIS